MRMYNFYLGFLLIALLTGCTEAQENSYPSKEIKAVDLPTIRPKQLNISVLIDLSNRIDYKLHPEQAARDIAIIGDLTGLFKKNVDAFGAFKADGKLRVYFQPEPEDPGMALIAKKLTANCIAGNRPENAKHNKQVYSTVDTNFRNGIESIYSLANKTSSYPGSDIWRFMKDDARNRCVEDTALFRNVLVILTDGYLYYKNEMRQKKNRYTYIERNFSHFNRFRDSRVLDKEFDKQDYGFESTGENLNGLEVLVMGIDPTQHYPQDYDIIKKYWAKWLKEMKVQHFALVKSELPVYSQKSLSDFFNYQYN